MTPLARDYFLLSFIAATGVLQIAAAYADLKGMLFIRNRVAASLLGLGLVLAVFVWFYLPEPPNLNDTDGGLNGNTQTYLFTAGASAALVFTLLLSSLRNLYLGSTEKPYSPGLEALRDASYAKALLSTLRRLWKRLREPTQP